MPQDSSIKVRTCSMCQGLGTVPDPTSQRTDPICPICKGGGWVAGRCRCGRAAVVLHEKTLEFYCGQSVCEPSNFQQPTLDESARQEDVDIQEFWRRQYCC